MLHLSVDINLKTAEMTVQKKRKHSGTHRAFRLSFNFLVPAFFYDNYQKGLLRFQQSVELRTVSWEHFPDGWPNLFIENVKQDCAGRDGKWFSPRYGF